MRGTWGLRLTEGATDSQLPPEFSPGHGSVLEQNGRHKLLHHFRGLLSLSTLFLRLPLSTSLLSPLLLCMLSACVCLCITQSVYDVIPLYIHRINSKKWGFGICIYPGLRNDQAMATLLPPIPYPLPLFL